VAPLFFINERYGRGSESGAYLLATPLVELVLAKVAMWKWVSSSDFVEMAKECREFS
jgi:hypothetical protein